MNTRIIKRILIFLIIASLTVYGAFQILTTKNGKRQGPPSIAELFKMDSDQDGLISRSEAKGPLSEQFSKIDTDSDGFISKKELEDAPKPKR